MSLKRSIKETVLSSEINEDLLFDQLLNAFDECGEALEQINSNKQNLVKEVDSYLLNSLNNNHNKVDNIINSSKRMKSSLTLLSDEDLNIYNEILEMEIELIRVKVSETQLDSNIVKLDNVDSINNVEISDPIIIETKVIKRSSSYSEVSKLRNQVNWVSSCLMSDAISSFSRISVN